MTSDRSPASRALLRAHTVRKSGGLALTSPVCPFDLAERLGVEVRYVDIPSMEGMYVGRTPPLILIAADRPAGRQAFTCAHELGHHVFEHGTRADLLDLDPRRSDPAEHLADLFAGFLLMPKSAVVRGFSRRGWSPAEATPEQVHIVAGWLGVSYQGLVTHLCRSLRLLSGMQEERLLGVSPRQIREAIAGRKLACPLHVLDAAWCDRPVDVRVGDYVLSPANVDSRSPLLTSIAASPGGRLHQATAPGIGLLESADGSWQVYVRVMRQKFAGRSIFRHLEDPDYGCTAQAN